MQSRSVGSGVGNPADRGECGMAVDGFLKCPRPPAWPRRPKKEGLQALGRSAGGPTTKIHLVCDALGNPYRFSLSEGQVHDVTVAPFLLGTIDLPGDYLIADKGYDSDEFRALIREKKREPVIPGRNNRKQTIEYDKNLYSIRNLIEHAFCRLKQFRAVATRYDKLSRNFAGMVFLACIFLWLRL